MDASRPYQYDLSDYIGMLRRQWWVITVFTLLGITAATGFTVAQTPMYEATTSVLVLPTGVTEANLAGGRTNGTINLDTEAQLVRSLAVAQAASEMLESSATPAELVRHVSVEVPPNTAVLMITFTDPTPRGAQAGSHAFAEAYLRNREESARAEVAAQTESISEQIADLQAELQAVTDELAAQPPGSAGQALLMAQQSNLTGQLNELTTQLNRLRTTTVLGGRIISDAQLPSRPSTPVTSLNLIGGLMVGLALGTVAGLARDKLDRRIRKAADVTRRTGVPVLATLPESAPLSTTAMAVGSRVRNEVMATLRAPHPVILVSGATPGPTAAIAAINLAAAFAYAGKEVVLVSADTSDTTISRAFSLPNIPGLIDALAGRARLNQIVHSPVDYPHLRVVPAGRGNGSTGLLLQSEGVRRTLTELRRRADYLVLHAPSTARSADAQSLACLSETVIIGIELGQTRVDEIADATEQFHRVGIPPLGAVALHRSGTDPWPVPVLSVEGRLDDLFGSEDDTIALPAGSSQPLKLPASPGRAIGASATESASVSARRPTPRRSKAGSAGKRTGGSGKHSTEAKQTVVSPQRDDTVVLTRVVDDPEASSQGFLERGVEDDTHVVGR